MKGRDLLYGVDNKSNSYILQSVMNNKMVITDRKVTDKKLDLEYVYRSHRNNHKSSKQFAGNKIQTKKKLKNDRTKDYGKTWKRIVNASDVQSYTLSIMKILKNLT